MISDLEARIRNLINARRKQHELLGRSVDWNRLCSALDVIGDTELGLTAYLHHDQIEDRGLCYLHVYGALQLLQTQQDAAAEICSALGIKPQVAPKLPIVREVRSSAVAHPTRQKANNRVQSNFIVRSTLSQHGFTLFTVIADEWPFIERSVNIPKLAEEQRDLLSTSLLEVVSVLEEDEMQHHKRFRDDKLSSCFPSTLGYYFSKIFEAIYSPRSSALGTMHVALVMKCLQTMRVLLEKRGEWGIYDSIDYEYQLLQYPLEQLATFFGDRSTSRLNDQDAYIFCAFVREQIKTLQQIADEIDEKYAEPPANGD